MSRSRLAGRDRWRRLNHARSRTTRCGSQTRAPGPRLCEPQLGRSEELRSIATFLVLAHALRVTDRAPIAWRLCRAESHPTIDDLQFSRDFLASAVLGKPKLNFILFLSFVENHRHLAIAPGHASLMRR